MSGDNGHHHRAETVPDEDSSASEQSEVFSDDQSETSTLAEMDMVASTPLW